MLKPLSQLLGIDYPNKAKTNEAFAHLQDGDFIAGGCALYAIALKTLEPAIELVILKSVSGPEHCVLKYGGYFYDADGEQSYGDIVAKLMNEFNCTIVANEIVESIDTEQCAEIVDVNWDIPRFIQFMKIPVFS
jgi:hypothetical protein